MICGIEFRIIKKNVYYCMGIIGKSFHPKRNMEKVCIEVNNQVLWMNSFLKIGGELFLMNSAKRAGITYMKDIVHDDGRFLSLDEIHNRNGDCFTQMQYNSLISGIPKTWKNCLKLSKLSSKRS